MVYQRIICHRPSVCRLSSVTFVRPTQPAEIFGNVSRRHLVHLACTDIQVKFYGDHPRGTPPSGALNTRVVAFWSYRRLYVGNGARYKLLLITNRKSHTSFRLVPNSVTLNDLELRNSPNRCVISSNSVDFGTDYV